VYGRYVLRRPEATVELTLKQDMAYEESIRFTSGQVVVLRGKWRFGLADRDVELDGAAQVSAPLDPDHIRRIDTGMEGGRWWFGRMHLTAYAGGASDLDFVQEDTK
jgi:hypothetical protein